MPQLTFGTQSQENIQNTKQRTWNSVIDSVRPSLGGQHAQVGEANYQKEQGTVLSFVSLRRVGGWRVRERARKIQEGWWMKGMTWEGSCMEWWRDFSREGRVQLLGMGAACGVVWSSAEMSRGTLRQSGTQELQTEWSGRIPPHMITAYFGDMVRTLHLFLLFSLWKWLEDVCFVMELLAHDISWNYCLKSRVRYVTKINVPFCLSSFKSVSTLSMSWSGKTKSEIELKKLTCKLTHLLVSCNWLF